VSDGGGGGGRQHTDGRAGAAVMLLQGTRAAAEVLALMGGRLRQSEVVGRRRRSLGFTNPRIIGTLPVVLMGRWTGSSGDGGGDDDCQTCVMWRWWQTGVGRVRWWSTAVVGRLVGDAGGGGAFWQMNNSRRRWWAAAVDLSE